ncbi:MAG TPA: rhodanese-like domain-containing protein [Candidatus Eisenbacteria bacterium]|nr:rhodanese-like domain-containing protein [Candidatus Eisenbacteria bacterium]
MGLKTIAPHALRKCLDAGSAVAIDVNARADASRMCVPTARCLDHATFAADDLPADRDITLVFYCSNPMCSRAPRAARRALRMGYRDVRVMSAGISGWIAAGLPTVAGEPQRA